MVNMSKCPAEIVCVCYKIRAKLRNNTLFLVDIRTLDIVEGFIWVRFILLVKV